MTLQTVLLCCHIQLSSSQPEWSYVAPIIISVLSLIVTGIAVYVGYHIPSKVALMQLKQEAIKELRDELTRHFDEWRKNINYDPTPLVRRRLPPTSSLHDMPMNEYHS